MLRKLGVTDIDPNEIKENAKEARETERKGKVAYPVETQDFKRMQELRKRLRIAVTPSTTVIWHSRDPGAMSRDKDGGAMAETGDDGTMSSGAVWLTSITEERSDTPAAVSK